MNQKLLQITPKSSDNFLLCGGTSLQAIEFLNLMKRSSFRDQIDVKFLDNLLNRTFFNVIDELTKPADTSDKTTAEDPFQNIEQASKKKRFTDEKPLLNISKTNRAVYLESSNSVNDSLSSIELAVKWKHNTMACVDATVLFVMTENDESFIYIGSHSGYFYCINPESGASVWEFNAGDRIESSACLSKCGKYIIFGKNNDPILIRPRLVERKLSIFQAVMIIKFIC